ncbi:MAG: hypothetical protein MI799_09225 [Desulfobacterales bacterium]|nr:hypothetical protein [Desulfobacterales bacterium]
MQINSGTIHPAGIAQASSGNLQENKTYSSLGQMSRALVNYGKEQSRIYSTQFASMGKNGKIGVDELKETIKTEFPMYTMVPREPADVVDGRNLLYIDENNLRKMADNPEYRAKVFGLMRREGDSGAGTTTVRMNGGSHSFRTTGSVFSLSDGNESVGGIPYKGSARSISMSSTAISSSNSLSTGKDESWYEKMLEKIKEQRETKEALLEKAREKREMEQAPRQHIDMYL